MLFNLKLVKRTYIHYITSCKFTHGSIELNVFSKINEMFLHMAVYPDSKIHGANIGPPGSCRSQMGPMLPP